MNDFIASTTGCVKRLILLGALMLVPPALHASEIDMDADHSRAADSGIDVDGGGEVRVPLHAYTALINQLRQDPRPAPAAYAVGQSRVSVKVAERDNGMVATVNVTVTIETFENEWTLVPILPAGTALSQASVNGKPVQLVQGPDGLSWSTATAGTVTMQLRYGVNASRSESGFVLPLPIPYAAATQLKGNFPGDGLDLAVIPSANLRSVDKNGTTRISADLPGTSSILISWRTPSKQPYVIGRARYDGTLSNNALVWTAHFDVEVFSAEPLSLPLMPASVTLNDARVDDKRATVFDKDGQFTVGLQGRGMRKVTVVFEVPVTEGNGPPQAQVPIPRIPVSEFQLTLPGRKEIKVAPAANVNTHDAGENTLATVFVPMVEQVLFSWSDAVPEDLQTRVRANASLYHTVHAEEGVLHGRVLTVWEITHGETSQLVLDIPDSAQVNRIVAPSGGISDWAVVAADDGRKRINVFLDRAITGEFILDTYYEQLLGARDAATQAIAVPLLSAIDVHRQRGMLALLSGQELALNPQSEERVSRVGENQLPAFVRNQITLTVAHTYKYTDPVPLVTVKAQAPERKQGKFDAQVNTLISLGEVTMKGSATIELDVKSGSIADLFLRLPGGVNVLGVSGPSLRTHHVRDDDGGQTIEMEFTREMEGQFRVEVNYERIMTNVDADLDVPTVTVSEAEVEHGRIAIEALTAVEVRATTTEQLSTLDINELPQQLVFKTTNPILLAYRYVHAKPPFKLALKVTRHEEIEVQVAAIENASYTTLYTRDGLAVTTARFDVRNSRRQFLRLELPPASQVWSAFVDGKAEKPAHASGTEDTTAVLIRMINSTTGFPVEIVYTTPADNMHKFGSMSGQLPRPDMVVTHTRWDVFLPSGHRYFAPHSTLDVSVRGTDVNPREAGGAALRSEDMRKVAMGQPLRITVPAQGVHFAFEKLYANQSLQPAQFTVRYAARDVSRIALAVSLLGTLIFWAALGLLLDHRMTRRNASALLAIGAVTVSAMIGVLGVSPLPASGLSAALAGALLLTWAAQWYRGRNLTVTGADT
jgi:hypothetical protein